MVFRFYLPLFFFLLWPGCSTSLYDLVFFCSYLLLLVFINYYLLINYYRREHHVGSMRVFTPRRLVHNCSLFQFIRKTMYATLFIGSLSQLTGRARNSMSSGWTVGTVKFFLAISSISEYGKSKYMIIVTFYGRKVIMKIRIKPRIRKLIFCIFAKKLSPFFISSPHI